MAHPSREERIRERLFPGVKTFQRGGGFASLPLELRKAIGLFEPRAWQIYTYILMRAGPAWVAWMSLSEMAFDLRFQSLPKLRIYINQLERAGWIGHAKAEGKDYFVIIDPFVAIDALRSRGDVDDEHWDSFMDLRLSLEKARGRSPDPGTSESDESPTA